ncbi:hypothetical protein RNJ44_02861 [Nakaseomyces bracarensis]|uniref:YTH domain-containing protein n=1 Tax=Nakaseomyces bracarensis TaxID=273131 RepID=A0ABR4P0G3_9SACH
MSRTREYSVKILETFFDDEHYDRKGDLGQKFILPGILFGEDENRVHNIKARREGEDVNHNEQQCDGFLYYSTESEKSLAVTEIARDNYSSSIRIPKTNKSLAIIPAWITVPQQTRFFVIKSSNLDHVKRSFYNGIWSSTHFGNRKLSQAYKELNNHAKLFLLFSVNSSGRFCGVAEMVSDIESHLDTSLWDDSYKFGGAFRVRWVIVRDLNNRSLKRFIIVENDMKSITKSRDAQEVPFEIGQSMLKLFLFDKSSGTQCFLDPEYQ